MTESSRSIYLAIEASRYVLVSSVTCNGVQYRNIFFVPVLNVADAVTHRIFPIGFSGLKLYLCTQVDMLFQKSPLQNQQTTHFDSETRNERGPSLEHGPLLSHRFS
jgi:hypothetical protein